MDIQSQNILKLDEQFNAIIDELENSGNTPYFITGRAGTGKSTLLRLFRQSSRKKIVVLAPTGIAALHVGGQTIHSFFRFPPRLLSPSEIKRSKNKKLINSLDIIVIDEISMVRADMMDNIDQYLRLNRNSEKPFGGVKMVFFGDLFQLPPVVAHAAESQYLEDHYDSPYFFSSHVLVENPELCCIELTKIYRQREKEFINILEEIRMNTADWDTLETINRRFLPGKSPPEDSITICSRKYIAKGININKLNTLPGNPKVFQAKTTGNFSRNTSPAPTELILKKGAQIMFVKNDPAKQFVNGSLGKIVEIGDHAIKVRLQNVKTPKTITVYSTIWENIKYKINSEGKIESEVTGTFEQFPVTLAWAITIHKSQGMTFDNVAIDLGTGAFDFGQSYVALSRCTHFNGIFLKRPFKPNDIMTDDKIVEFYRKNF
ncbi:ATP-dependent DNA helicase [Membranihabitans maritimus]|uniref:ATP-dependent DNA helicase n=1 Tax=Membranihabitans maritimus TaxID=2904244 RepID=UPI001F438779|nr:DEAD/DEAH box helicase [Membranihabitans maritimus]